MKNSKKLALFLPSLHGGGAEKTMLNLAAGIAARGYKVDFVLVKAKGQYLDQFPGTVRLVDLKASRAIMCFPALIRYLRMEQPDCLLSALHVNTIALIASMISNCSTRVIVSERTTVSHLVKNSSSLRLKLVPILIRSLYPLADRIVAVSKGVAEDLSNAIGISRNRIEVIYNPVVTPLLRKKARAYIKHPWFEENAPPVILSVGSLTPQKNFGLLISAFAYLRQTQKARLLILGEGEKRHELESQVKRLNLQQDIKMPGFVENPYPYMTRSAVFVLPSKREGLPGVIIEALYCGIPIVATDCPGGSSEILANGKYGKIVPVRGPKTMAHAIKSALNGETPHPTHKSWKPYELETVVDQYLNTLFRN